MKIAALEMSCTEASVLGAYRPDRFVMMVPDVTKKPLTFVHEYFHYLQNVTTVHGIRSFEASQQLLAVFSNTLTLMGVSEGDAALSEEQRANAATHAQFRRAAEGEAGRNHDPEVTSTVIRHEHDRLRFALKWPGQYSQQEADVRIGGHAIKESVAHLVERHVAGVMQLEPPRAPEFPYSILERLFAFIAPEQQDQPLTIAALGTLALLTRNPGCRLSPPLTPAFSKPLTPAGTTTA